MRDVDILQMSNDYCSLIDIWKKDQLFDELLKWQTLSELFSTLRRDFVVTSDGLQLARIRVMVDLAGSIRLQWKEGANETSNWMIFSDYLTLNIICVLQELMSRGCTTEELQNVMKRNSSSVDKNTKIDATVNKIISELEIAGMPRKMIKYICKTLGEGNIVRTSDDALLRRHIHQGLYDSAYVSLLVLSTVLAREGSLTKLLDSDQLDRDKKDLLSELLFMLKNDSNTFDVMFDPLAILKDCSYRNRLINLLCKEENSKFNYLVELNKMLDDVDNALVLDMYNHLQ